MVGFSSSVDKDQTRDVKNGLEKLSFQVNSFVGDDEANE